MTSPLASGTTGGVPYTFAELSRACVGIDAEVPILGGWHRYVSLDNAATTPALRPVQEAVDRFLPWYSSVHRGTGYKSRLSTEIFERCRATVAELVGASPTDTVIFGKNTTEMVNKLSRRLGLSQADVVCLSDAEHHSNDLPWRKVAQVVRLPVDRRGEMNLNALEVELRRGRVRVVAATGASNVTGYVSPIHEIAALAHRYGALCFADCAQLAPHRRIDMRPTGDPGHLDFLAFSAHKMYAPYGVGVLVGPRRLFDQGEPDHVGGGMVEVVTATRAYWSASPDRDEPGTPNLLGAVALARAIRCLLEVGFDAIAGHERRLTEYALGRLSRVPGITLYGDPAWIPGEDRVGVIPFNLAGLNHALLASALGWEGGIGVRNGCFCAHPFINRLLELTEADSERMITKVLGADRSDVPGLVRLSFGIYNDERDVDELCEALERLGRAGPRGSYRFDPLLGEYLAEGATVALDRSFGI
ncbi:MAG: aminotransferase class V-fold PLP-dependent enzyme [Deltaproteobacteria bacterium]